MSINTRVTTGAPPCTLAQSDVEASRCGCFAHAMHSVQGAARCANHCDAPRCRCTQVVMHRGARCTSVHGDARRAKMRCLSQYLTSLVFLVLLQCCPSIRRRSIGLGCTSVQVHTRCNRAGMHLGAGVSGCLRGLMHRGARCNTVPGSWDAPRCRCIAIPMNQAMVHGAAVHQL